MAHDSLIFILVAVLAAYIIGLAKGGFASIGMLAVPLMALIMPTMQAAGLTLPIFIVSDLFAVILYRRSFSKRNLLILVPAALIGTLIGWMTATSVSEHLMKLAIGLIGFLFCLYMAFGNKNRPAQPADVPRGIFWGIVTGFTSFISHSGAPPYQIYVLPQRLQPLVFAGTTTWFFAIVNLSKIGPYLAMGELSSDNLLLTLTLIPAAFLGTITAWKLIKIMPAYVFFQIVQWALFLVSCKLIYDGVVGLL